jgi:hypothetical protein
MSRALVSRPFQPIAATQNAAVTSTPATITLTHAGADVSGTVRIANIGTQTVFIRLDGTAADVTTAIPLLANTVEVFSLLTGATTIKHVAAASGSTLYVTPGVGA